MSDYKERMKHEHKELKAKVEALGAFIHGNEIFSTLDDIERADMIKQYGFMEAYLRILDSRIWRAK
ncbi:hypothetical protein NVP1239O_04 [Vibrio phage 1.239.O._10N.261.52.F6]|nr:hypothetical protein NVP1239O_04 [Vibrio phage 1.239.O._10N.261.52.F6]